MHFWVSKRVSFDLYCNCRSYLLRSEKNEVYKLNTNLYSYDTKGIQDDVNTYQSAH